MPTTSPNHDNRTFMERMSDALVYVLAFPFIIFGIALKRAFTQGGSTTLDHIGHFSLGPHKAASSVRGTQTLRVTETQNGLART
ncbi:unnamed protein product [Aureobasidium pullulans]|nr:unnamed protein product [Aureobasidium pullulans]